MASPFPLLLIGAALLLMGKKKGGGSGGTELPAGAGATGDGNGNGNGDGASDGTGDGTGDGAPSEGIPAQSVEQETEPDQGSDLPDLPKPQFKHLVLPFAMAPPPGPGAPPPDPDAPEPEPEAPDPGPPPPPPAPGLDVPEGAYCSDVANWDPAWVALELEMLAAVNAVRAQGFSCPGIQQAPVPPLVMNPSLRCAARKHSKDMAEKGYFSHTNPEGEESWDRMMAAGYNGTGFSENIAAGSQQIQHTMDQWLTSTAGHCEALFDPVMKEIGIGYYPTNTGYQFYWTQNFGKY